MVLFLIQKIKVCKRISWSEAFQYVWKQKWTKIDDWCIFSYPWILTVSIRLFFTHILFICENKNEPKLMTGAFFYTLEFQRFQSNFFSLTYCYAGQRFLFSFWHLPETKEKLSLVQSTWFLKFQKIQFCKKLYNNGKTFLHNENDDISITRSRKWKLRPRYVCLGYSVAHKALPTWLPAGLFERAPLYY